MARFEATVVKGKRRQLRYYNSCLFKLIRKTATKLQTKYKNKSPQPDWYVHFGFYKVFGFQNVPMKEFSNLKNIFKEYIDRVLEVKRHRHRFVFVVADIDQQMLKLRRKLEKAMSEKKKVHYRNKFRDYWKNVKRMSWLTLSSSWQSTYAPKTRTLFIQKEEGCLTLARTTT